MKLFDPTVSVSQGQNSRAPRLSSIDGLKIGLLSNGKANADLLLKETAALFEERHGCELLELACKANSSGPAPGPLIERLARECDWLLTATGD